MPRLYGSASLMSGVSGRAVSFMVAALLTLAALLLGACDAERPGGVRGSGTVASERREVGDFQRLRISGAIEATITVGGGARTVEVTADDNILPVIRTETEGDRLVIEARRSYWPSGRRPLVTITVPRLAEVEASGATRVVATGLGGDEFRTTVSGASRLELTGNVRRHDTRVSGASSVLLRGQGERLTAEVSGASTLTANEYGVRAAELRISGASKADVQASETISGNASGASTITYGGAPRLAVDTTGASRVRAR